MVFLIGLGKDKVAYNVISNSHETQISVFCADDQELSFSPWSSKHPEGRVLHNLTRIR